MEHKKPVMGLLHWPYRETGAFGASRRPVAGFVLFIQLIRSQNRNGVIKFKLDPMNGKEDQEYKGRFILAIILSVFYLAFFQSEKFEELPPVVGELIGLFIGSVVLMYIAVFVLEKVWSFVKDIINKH